MHRRRETLGDRRRRGMDAGRGSTQRPATITSRQRPRRGWRTPARRAGASAGTPSSAGPRAVDHQRVGARARRRGPSARCAGRGGAAGERARRTGARRVDGRPRSRRGGDVAPPPRQALAVLEQAQLLAPVARDVAVGADRQRHAGGEPAAAGRRRPSPRLASVLGQSTTPAPLRATASISAGVAWVAWTSCQRASSSAFARQPLDRPRAGGGEAVVDLARSARRRGCGSARRSLGAALGQLGDRRRRARRAASGSPRRRSTQRPAGGARSPRAAPARPPADAGEAALVVAQRRLRRSRRARRAPAAASGRCRRRRRRRPAPTTSSSGSA